MHQWFVYVLLSESSGRTYVGITIDTERRLSEHNGELPNRGAKATRAGRPWKISRTLGPYKTRGEALKIEYKIKSLRGMRRLLFEAD